VRSDLLRLFDDPAVLDVRGYASGAPGVARDAAGKRRGEGKLRNFEK